MSVKKIPFVLFVFFATFATFAQSTIILQQGRNGYTGCEDTYNHFHSNDTSTTDVNHGSDSDLFIKDCFAWYEWARGAVKFDLSPVPTGEWVSSAIYSMYFFKGEFTGVNCSLFTFDKPWDVYASTWNQADSSTKWITPGGDCKRKFISWTPFA